MNSITRRTLSTLVATATCASTLLWSTCAPATLTAHLGLGTPAAVALPFPVSPESPETREQWISPQARSQDSEAPIRVLLESTEPAAPTIGDTVRARLRLINHGQSSITGLSLQAQRAGQQTSLSDARSILAADSSAFSYNGPRFKLPDELQPGQETIIDVELPTAADKGQSLGISAPGVYPLSLTLSGDEGRGTAYVGSTHFLLSVGADEATEDSADSAATQQEAQPAGMSLLWPLSAHIDIIAGETGTAPGAAPLVLANENLAAELAQGGRLYQLLDAYVQATGETNPAGSGEKLRSGSCLALDPQLIDTVSRMSQGYSVAEQRPSPVAPKLRLRDSWGSAAEDVPSTPGSAPLVAGEWLAKLRTAAQNSCVVALPWANTDINALSRTGNEWLLREAVSQGANTISEIVGVEPLRNVVVPGSGYVTEQTASRLGVAEFPHTDEHHPVPTAENAWEELQSTLSPSEQREGSAETALSDTSLPNPDSATTSSQPSSPMRVLVADNTVWAAPREAQFSTLAPGIIGVSYQSSLAATLAALGTDPETTGYSNTATRFDYRIDSPAARSLNAQSALRLSVSEAADTQDAPPVLIVPPALFSSVDDARALLATASELLASNAALPVPVEQAVTPSTEQDTRLHEATPPQQQGKRFGAPFDDPTVIADTEILRVAQQGNYIDDLTRLMVNDPAIALTRYRFTAPLQHDLLRALTINSRRSLSTYDAAITKADTTLNLNREMLVNLRRSVTLLPPGNVYTRTSDASPLLIVARNGLPLPVDAHIMYDGPKDAAIHAPEQQRIPARGSITTQMTADLPEDHNRTDLTLWLATPAGDAISDSVRIGVQTRGGFFGAYGVMALIAALVLALVYRVRRMVKNNRKAALKNAKQTAEKVSESTSEHPQHSRRPHSGHADQNSGSPRPPGA